MQSSGYLECAQPSPADLTVRILFARTDSLRAGEWNHRAMENTFWRFYLNDKEGGLLVAAGVPLKLEAGAVYIVPPGLELSSRNSAPLNQFFIHFDIEDIPPAVLRELFPHPLRVPEGTGVPQLAADLMRNLRTANGPTAALQALARGAVYAALGHCIAALPPESYTRFWERMSALNPVLPALQYMQENLGNPMSNLELARRCHLSEDHFIRTFGELVGQPPSRYLRKRRIAQAAQKLLLTNLSVDQIAVQCGFSDRFYFSRAFTQQMGVPPATYRKRPRF